MFRVQSLIKSTTWLKIGIKGKAEKYEGVSASMAVQAFFIEYDIKKNAAKLRFFQKYGAGSGTWTHTVSLPPDFESGTSANSIMPAKESGKIFFNVKTVYHFF